MKQLIGVMLALSVLSCNDTDTETTTNTSTDKTTQGGTADTMAANPQPQIQLLLDISDRTVYVIRQGDTEKKYAVAVGMGKYPTPTGEFKIHKVDWNPDWNPPSGDWADDKEPKKPGEKGNPMGRARLVYQMPYTLHGTKDVESLGKAESHGSVRMANADVIELGKLLMKEGGSDKDEAWVEKALQDSTSMYSTDLKMPIPLTNRP